MSTTIDSELAEWLENLMYEHEYTQAKAIDHSIRLARAYTELLQIQKERQGPSPLFIPQPEDVMIRDSYSRVRREKSDEGDVDVDRRESQKFLQ